MGLGNRNGAVIPQTNPHSHTLTTAATGAHQHTFSGTIAAPKYRKKFPKWKTGLKNLRDLQKDQKLTPARYFYQPLPLDTIISELGDYCPMHGGIPKDFAMIMLKAINRPQKMLVSYEAKGAGLMYTIPFEVGRHTTRTRTSINGLKLMQHWATKYPSFKPYLDAFTADWAVRELTLDCVDLALGNIPERFKNIEEINEAKIKVIKEKRQAEFQAEQMRLMQSMQQQSDRLRMQQMEYVNAINQLQPMQPKGLFSSSPSWGLLSGGLKK